jgi:hypothetical protein
MPVQSRRRAELLEQRPRLERRRVAAAELRDGEPVDEPITMKG